MKINSEQIDSLLSELDKYAREYDKYEYGLPIGFVDSDEELSDQRLIVQKWFSDIQKGS